MPPAPPTFNSFPAQQPTQPPPTFASFPDPAPVASSSRSHSSRRERSPSPKRHRSSRPTQAADEFLDGLSKELGLPRREGKERERGDRSDGRDKRRSSTRDDDRERSKRSHGERDRSSREGKESERRSGKSERDRDLSDDERRRRRREDKRRDERPRRERSPRGESEHKSKSYQLVQAGEGDSPPRSAAPPAERVFFSSVQGDEDNIRYAAMPKSNVPRYRRFGGGRVLGLNSGWRITLDTAWTGRGIVVAPADYVAAVRYADPKVVAQTATQKYKRITGTARSDGTRIVRRTDASLPPDPFLPSAEDPSRFVPLEPDEEDEDNEAERARDQDELFRQRNIEFDKSLREEPHNVELWLSFVSFQDEVARKSFGDSASAAIKRSTAEVKLSIIERALDVSGNGGSEALLLAHFAAGRVVWEPRKVRKRWKAAIKDNPGLLELRRAFDEWKETTIEDDFV